MILIKLTSQTKFAKRPGGRMASANYPLQTFLLTDNFLKACDYMINYIG